MQIKRTLPNNRNRGSVDDKGTVRGTWRPISLDWRMQSGVAFYDSTWWRYAKGLPPRDKCCRPFRPQLRIPIESLSRKTDKSEVIWADKSEWIGAWIIFDFEILVAAVLRRIRLLRKPDRFCCPFIRTVIDAIRLIDTVTVSIPIANLSLSTGGFHSLDAVQKGTLKWESSLELSSYRSVVGQFGSSNCAMNTTYRPGGILTEERCNPTHRHPFY